MKRKRLLTFLLAGLLVITILAPIASVSAATETQTFKCTIDINTNAISCTGGAASDGWSHCTISNFVGLTYDWTCSRDFTLPAAEIPYASVKDLPAGTVIETWAGGSREAVLPQQNGDTWYVKVNDDDTLETRHNAQWTQGVFSWDGT